MSNKDFLFRVKADTSGYDANLAKAKKQLDGFAKANLSAGGAIKQLSGQLVSVAARFASVTAVAGALGAAFKSNISTALRFEKSMSQLSSLTGMVGVDLERLKGYAIELGSTTTLTASQVADAFRTIGSQQPQLLQSGEALKQVTKYAITLSEAAGIELATAAQTLSTSINQMGGNSENAARYVNVLAAASQKGAGDIAWLGEALTKSATAAKAVGTDYEELVANLEQLAKAGFDASTAGTALRSIIMNLEKQSNRDFKPSVVGLTQAFENLGKAQLDITGYQELAGKLFATQAKVLAEAAGAAREMTTEITGTNIAEEQAKTNTDNLEGSLKSLSSAWEGLNLHINASNGFLKSCVDWLKDTVQWLDNTFTSAGRARKALEDLNGGKGKVSRMEMELGEVKYSMQGEGDSGRIRQQQILDRYDNDIAAKQKELDAANKQVENALKIGNYASLSAAQNIAERIKNEVEALKTLKQEFKTSSDAIISPAPVADVKTTQDIIEETKKPSGKKGTGPIVPFAVEQQAYAFSDFSSTKLKNIEKVAWPEPLAYLQQMESYADRIREKMQMAASPEQYATLAKALEGVQQNIDEFTGKKNPGEQLADGFSAAASSISAVGGALASLEDPASKVASTIAQAVATIALGYAEASLMAAKNPANAGWGWIAFAASGIATMVSSIAAIKSATAGSYATGGVIPGNSYSGDNQIAMVNAGETILTRAQTNQLASSLQSRAAESQSRPYVTGESIYLGLNNYLKATGRGSLITSRG